MPRRRRRPPQEFIADIRVADDGLRPVREAHDWTRNKLGILASYLSSYARACTGAGAFYFVDAMAGPGICHIAETEEFLLGSTLIAARTSPLFDRVLALDLAPANVEVLRARTASFGERVIAQAGDANRDLLPLMEQHIPKTAPSFVLLDPEGAELEWATVRGIADFRQPRLPRARRLKAEMLILFPTEGMNRMLPVEADIALHNEMRLNQLFPPQSHWRDTWERRRSGKITPAQARERYVEGYKSGLDALGYRSVLSRSIERPGRGVVYHLVFATDHPAGEAIMDDVFGHMNPNEPQQRLF